MGLDIVELNSDTDVVHPYGVNTCVNSDSYKLIYFSIFQTLFDMVLNVDEVCLEENNAVR